MDAPYKLGVVGNPIAHSLSPQIHHALATGLNITVDYQKILAPLQSEDANGFETTISHFFEQGGTGLNITVPFKEEAFKLCQGLSERAKIARAVNTLYLQDNQLMGDNTDGVGLVKAIQNLATTQSEWQLSGANVAILGAGGASRGVLLPLIEAGVAHICVANRTTAKAEKLVNDVLNDKPDLANQLKFCGLEELAGEFDIIINATSSSLQGQALALDPKLKCACAYDMVYKKDQSLTPFMHLFQQKNALVADGFGMLVGQAAVSFEIWTGKHPVFTLEDMTFILE